ncbi:MAG: hypothetical protein PVF43_11005, partial [Candidatus Eiseniibacteriota bacterium]
MSARSSRSRLAILAIAYLLLVAPAPANAAIVFDDHFEGNSGGLPAGWSGEGDGSVVESGTTVTFHDDFAMWTDVEVDPNAENVTVLRIVITGTTGHTSGGLVDFAELANHFWIKLHGSDGKIEVKASN